MSISVPGPNLNPRAALALQVATGLTFSVDHVARRLNPSEESWLVENGQALPFMSGAAQLVSRVVAESVDWLMLGADLDLVDVEPDALFRLDFAAAEILRRALIRAADQPEEPAFWGELDGPDVRTRLRREGEHTRFEAYRASLEYAISDSTEERLAYIEVLLDPDPERLAAETADIRALTRWLTDHPDALIPHELGDRLAWLFDGADSALSKDDWPSNWRSNAGVDAIATRTAAGVRLVDARNEAEVALAQALAIRLGSPEPTKEVGVEADPGDDVGYTPAY